MNQFSSIFRQILRIFSKTEFRASGREMKRERGARRFTCREQLVAMAL
jgi:hypothetical protein